MCIDECLDLCQRQISGTGDAGGLIVRTCGTDFRVKTARRCGNEVDRNRLTVVWIGVMQRDGYIADNRTAAETAAFFRKEVEAMGVAVKAAKIEPN